MLTDRRPGVSGPLDPRSAPRRFTTQSEAEVGVYTVHMNAPRSCSPMNEKML